MRLAESLKAKVNFLENPTIGIICGSGLADIGDAIVDKITVSYTDIPGFPQTNGYNFSIII